MSGILSADRYMITGLRPLPISTRTLHYSEIPNAADETTK